MQWKNQDAASKACLGFTGTSRTVITALVIAYSQAIMSLWYINKEHAGSVADFAAVELGQGFFYDMWRVLTAGFLPFSAITPEAWTFLWYFFLLCAAHAVARPYTYGPVTPSGHRPRYTDNGLPAFLTHVIIFIWGSKIGLYPMGVVYDELGSILNALNYCAITFVALLYIKASVWPSTKDVSTYGNVLMDCFWGRELYPRICDVDIKQLTNCRFGMVFWAIATISFTAKATEFNAGAVPLSIAVSAALQLVYITKFFMWEAGYFNSLDIAQDHAGYYLCWGCLVYVPTMYTSMTCYMVQNDADLHPLWALGLLCIGLLMIWLNYDIDNQRATFRRTEGTTLIWGKAPTFIKASYSTADGTTRSSLLLTSGWWGMARHFHYVPEIAAAFIWSAAAGFDNVMPFLYVCYLTVLLINRSYRDDSRCAAKYGHYWDEYTKMVPYRVVPGVF